MKDSVISRLANAEIIEQVADGIIIVFMVVFTASMTVFIAFSTVKQVAQIYTILAFIEVGNGINCSLTRRATIRQCPDEHIPTLPACQCVVASSTGQRVVALATGKCVITGIAEQRVIALTARQRVIASAAN